MTKKRPPAEGLALQYLREERGESKKDLAEDLGFKNGDLLSKSPDILPGLDMTWEHLRTAEENGMSLDTYRCTSLESFFTLMERTTVEEAA